MKDRKSKVMCSLFFNNGRIIKGAVIDHIESQCVRLG